MNSQFGAGPAGVTTRCLNVRNEAVRVCLESPSAAVQTLARACR